MKNQVLLLIATIHFYGYTSLAAELPFDAELQCDIHEAGEQAPMESKILVKNEQGNDRSSAQIDKEVALKNGTTYRVTIKAWAESLTTNTDAITLSQSLAIQEKGGSFRTLISTGPTMFRAISFENVGMGLFKNNPAALCNRFNCSELRGEYGVSNGGSISVTCQIRGKHKL